MAQITLEKTEYDVLQNVIEAARQESAKARDELEAERARSFDDRLEELTKFAVAAKEVVDYAVANLNPEFSRNWPHEAMKTLADHVAKVGATGSRDQERALIWGKFRDSILDFERRWALAMMHGGSGTPSEIVVTEADVDTQIAKDGAAGRRFLLMAILLVTGLLSGTAIVIAALFS
jgi:hypothetical protein